MWSRIKSASVGRKLAALCTLAITVFFVLAVIGTMQFNAISAAAKNIVADKQYKAVVDDAQAQWLTDDDAMNMYAALTSLRDPAQASLAQTQWQTVTGAYAKATADLTQARTQAQSAHEAAIIDGLQRDLPTYQKFSDAMKAQIANGNLRAAVHSVTIDNAVRQASETATSGDVVLLAPACASFDQFVSYEHRGRVFKDLVKQLASRSLQNAGGGA